MAEVALGFATAVGGGGALAGASTFLSTTATILSGVATVGSVLSSFQQAAEEERAGRFAANEALIGADIARLEGDRARVASEARAIDVRRDALKKIGAARVAFGASGIDISSGQLAAVEDDILNERGYGLAIEKNNAKIALAEADLRAGQYEERAANSIAAGKARGRAARTRGVVTGAKGLVSIVRRG